MYKPKKTKINESQEVTQTTRSDGSVRTTYTQKTPNRTRSYTFNKNGSTRTTETVSRGSGWIDKKTTTSPKASKPPKPKKLRTSKSKAHQEANAIVYGILIVFMFLIGILQWLVSIVESLYG